MCSIACIGQSVQNPSYEKKIKGLLSHTVPEVEVKQATGKSNYLFLDAREEREFEVSHIANAKWVGYDDFNLSRLAGLNKSDSIIVYCSVGYRSEKVAEQLIKNGYENVYNLYGGVFEWVNQGNDVYNTSSKTTKVHAYDKDWGKWLNKGDKVYK